LRPTRFVAALVLVAIISTGFVTARLVTAWVTRRRLWLLLFATRRLDAAERAAKFFNLPFVGQLLAFGDFDEFQNFVEMINHLLERLGNFRGVFHGLGDSRGFGRTKISGLHPRLGALRLGATLLTAVIGTTIAKLFARRLGRARRFGFVMLDVFVMFRFVRSKICRCFGMRNAETTGGIGLMLRMIDMVAMIGGFNRWCGRFHGFRSRRNLLSGGRFAGLGRGARATAATTSTPTTATAVAGVTGSGGRV
jgi:hypothetical protein